MALIWSPILTSDTKPWEAGDPIPNEPPDESRRIHNEAGFSIVSPPNWTARNHAGTIYLTPKQVVAGRSKAGIVVSLHQDKPSDGNKFSEVEFLGRPAKFKVERRRSTFDDPALTTWAYQFQHNGEWVEVSYFIAEWHEDLPVPVKRYLETLRLSEEK
jgi:hypothetical protein